MTGADLRLFRKELGLSQADLARALGVSPPTIHRWENEHVALHGSVVTLVEMIRSMHWSISHVLTDWLKKRGGA